MSSGMSNVGNRSLYEAGDQRTRKAGDEDEHKADRYHEGKEHSHKPNDSKDERTIANKLAREEKRQHEEDDKSLQKKQIDIDPTLPAKSHGNEPSKGAKIDAEIAKEEEEMLKKKDQKK